MKQYLVQFSALLIILLVGAASAIEDTGNTDYTLVTYTGSNASITYDCGGFVKMGDVVTITATFNEPVLGATALVGNVTLLSNEISGNYSTVWTFTYNVPGNINNAVDVTVYGVTNDGIIEETDTAAFVVDNEKPIFKRIDPSSNPVYTKYVLFEFSAFDRLDNTIDYTIYIDGIEDEYGTMSSNGNVTYEPGLADGHYLLNITLEDDAGNIASTGNISLYVDSIDPTATPIYPENQTVVTENPLVFNFTAVDRFSANYSLEMNYQLYIDGESVGAWGSGTMSSGDYINIPYLGPADGAHNWSVTVEDKAGNNCSGKLRYFYVNCNGLEVSLISPNGGFVPANTTFNFSVAGGAGLPFAYELLINGTKVKNGTSVIDEDGLSYVSVEASVPDGVNIPWTVNVTDNAGRTYQPTPLYFSVDSVAPAPVANLTVTDAFGDTTWYYTYDEPGLYVFWDKNTEEDLYDGLEAYYGLPYVVFISDFEPSSVEEMQVAVPVSTIYETNDSKSLYMNIGTYGGEPLVYGKDYWVAVIALDRAGNYDDYFAMCGPVQTYEDMNITLDAGWNLKSVPKRLATFNADTCSAFGDNSTVIYWNGNSWEFPQTIEPCKGYWVYTPEDFELNVKFKPMPTSSASPDVPPSLDLASGWQMIGHTSTVPVHWSETLGSLQGLLGVEYKFSNLITYSQNEGWGGTISLGALDLLTESEETPYPVATLESSGAMVPGQGYWIFMKEDGTYASVESVDFYNETV